MVLELTSDVSICITIKKIKKAHALVGTIIILNAGYALLRFKRGKEKKPLTLVDR